MMKNILVITLTIYLLFTLGEAVWRWRKGKFNLLLVLVSAGSSLLLLAVTWSYAQAYADWQISLFALEFMVLGSLPQIYEYRQKYSLSARRHFIQFGWHILLIFLLYFLGQNF
ncbi:Uncharacterised protein [Streptococcus merionis]|uniref:Uncharacterized protein n=1 Tax=Streptococcus merionis TaxID=400065 RepID=A0A239SRI7_9STRE|nr:hypothetical protein [Streptococcus merionis]SNU87976.1 Uncharacterised protein [Streptococcus merionis]